MREAVLGFFVLRDGLYHHNRVDREIERAKTVYEKRLAAARLTNAKRDANRDDYRDGDRHANRDDKRAISEQPPPRTPPPPLPTHSPDGETDAIASVRTPRKALSKGSRLEADWKPCESDYSAGAELGLERPEIDAEAAEFRDYFHGADARQPVKRDWPRAFKRWIRQNASRRLANRARGG